MRVLNLLAGGLFAVLCGALAGCNAAPNASPDTAVVAPGSSARIDVLANDTDPDDDPLIIKRAWGADKGLVTINEDNTITYTPHADAEGNDEFTYRVKDNRGAARNARVIVSIEEGAGRALTVAPPAPQTMTFVTTPLTPRREVTPRRQTTPTLLATPEPRREPEVVPTTPPPPAPGASMIQSVQVTLHTTDDDKNREDAVRVVVRRGQEIVADRTFGVGELWGGNSDRAFELRLKPEVPVSDAGLLNIDVIKPPAGGAPGGGWAMQVEVKGRISDGRTVVLLPQTQPVKLGDGQPAQRSWSIPGINP